MDIGLFRPATQSAPSTAAPFSAKVTRRATTTATRPIRESGQVVNITGQATVKGTAVQGVTPRAGSLKQNNRTEAAQTATSSPVGTSAYRSNRGLFR